MKNIFLSAVIITNLFLAQLLRPHQAGTITNSAQSNGRKAQTVRPRYQPSRITWEYMIWEMARRSR